MDDIPITIDDPKDTLRHVRAFEDLLKKELKEEKELIRDFRTSQLKALENMLTELKIEMIKFSRDVIDLQHWELGLRDAETRAAQSGLLPGRKHPDVILHEQAIHQKMEALGRAKLQLFSTIRRIYYLLDKIMGWKSDLDLEAHERDRLREQEKKALHDWFKGSLENMGVPKERHEDALEACHKVYTRFTNHIMVIGGFLADMHRNIEGTVKQTAEGIHLKDPHDISARRFVTYIHGINSLVAELHKISEEQQQLLGIEKIALHVIDHKLREVHELDKNLRKHQFLTRADALRYSGTHYTKYRVN